MANTNPGFSLGQIPSPTDWDSYFAAKIDAANGTATNLTVSGTFTVAGAVTGSGFTALLNGIQQTATAQFFQNYGAFVNRINDRALVGAAGVNDANYPVSVKDYVETAMSNTTTLSQLASLSTIGCIGSLGGSQSLNNTSAGSEGTIGLLGFARNNNQTLVQTAYGGYFQANHETGILAGSITQGVEIDIVNLRGTAPTVNPYAPFASGATYGLFSASGGGVSSGLYDATLGILVANNNAAFHTGIMVGATAITGTNGVTGTGEAVSLARGHMVQWHVTGGAVAGNIVSLASLTTPAAATIAFTDTGLSIENSSGTALASLATASPAASGTAMMLLVNNNAGVNAVAVTLGATNSGGTGYRSLIVPN